MRQPAYIHHRPTGTARVRIAGREHSLGRYNSPESHAKYRALIREWVAVGSPRHNPTSERRTINDLVLAFWRWWAPQYPERSRSRMKGSLRVMRKCFGGTLAAAFDAKALQTVRSRMIELGWCRNEINARVRCIRACFDWAVSEGMFDASVAYSLRAVKGLRAGRSAARESEPVRPVSESIVEETLKHVTPTIAAMVRLQLLTGMRPGEVCAMTTGEIDTSGAVWLYVPRRHKTSHHGKGRTIAIGPRAQAVLAPFLSPALEQPVFKPFRSAQESRESRAAARKTPLARGNRAGTNRRAAPKRKPGGRYTTTAYRQAVTRACRRAGLPEWTPNQLRHTRATQVRKSHGLDAAGAMLGHAKVETTQVYAERDLGLAVQVAADMG